MPTEDATPGRTVGTQLELTRLILVERFVDGDSTLTGVVRAYRPTRRSAAG